tara:strand:+ start:195 stop:566 length:372 start_codon:yes stop_codon:yes gene_type:complete
MKVTRKQLREMVGEVLTEQTEGKLKQWQVRGDDYDMEEIIAVFTDKSAADSFLVKYNVLMDRLGDYAPWDPKDVSVTEYTPPPTDPDATVLLKHIWDRRAARGWRPDEELDRQQSLGPEPWNV